MSIETQALDELIDALQSIGSPPKAGGDAIDQVLDAPPRTTNVRSLQQNEDVQKFREDLTNGFVRIEVANQLFRTITEVLARLGGLK